MASPVLRMLVAGLPFNAVAWEWAGIFEVPDATYMWTAQKVNGSYADASMKIVALPTDEATHEKLHDLEGDGETALGLPCADVVHGGGFAIKPSTCYRLVFNNEIWQSLYTLNASAATHVAFFTEHVPTEFEATAHYLKDASGEDVEPVDFLPHPPPETVDWASSLFGAFIVNLCTLVGVCLAAPGISTLAQTNAKFVEGVFSAFAAGALLACAFFLLLFESTHLIATGWEAEVDVLWRWGTAILVGFFVPVVIESVTLGCSSSTSDAQSTREVEMGEKLDTKTVEAGAESVVVDSATKNRIVSAVLMGDFFHNLCDGFFIGAAFKGCGGAFGWGVVVSSALHELPQELADYTILTGSDVGWTPSRALLLNFLTGLSVLLGTIIVNISPVSDAIIGLLLAFGGGTYVYLASVVCMPKFANLKTFSQNLSGLFAFALGCVCIGLILLDHEHCPGDDHGHGGH